MKLHQLSLFLENRPGKVKAAVKILADAGINIVTMTLADTQQFGILRLIVKDWQAGRQALEAAGIVVNITEVIAIGVEDRPGWLMEVLEAIDKANLAIEYMYAFTSGLPGQKAALIFRFENPDAAIAALTTAGISVVQGIDLFDRA